MLFRQVSNTRNQGRLMLANPPVVIDISNRNLQFKKFDLSDYYTQVRYIKLKHPKSESGGRFFFDTSGYMEFEKSIIHTGIIDLFFHRGSSGFAYNSLFRFTNDYIIAGDAFFGIHCYDKQGNFLYTIEPVDNPKYDAFNDYIWYYEVNHQGYNGSLTVIGNYCLYRVREEKQNWLCQYDLSQEKRLMTRPYEKNALLLDDHSMVSYVYHPVRTHDVFLYTFALQGDTLCRFPNYQPVPEINRVYYSPLSPDIYYFGDRLTVRQSLNDTVYRLIPPDRLVPVYVLDFGSYRADIPTYFLPNTHENLLEKLLPYTWKESDKYILFLYTQNRDSESNRNAGSVKFFYSYFDKESGQLYHFSEGTDIPDDKYLIENSIPGAMPFLLSSADIENNQFRVYYSKKRLDKLIRHKEFASLAPELQQKLQTLRTELEESEVLIMILE